MLRLNSLLTHRLSDAVISLNAAGEIVDYNPAAKPYLRLCIDMLPTLRGEIVKLAARHCHQPRFLKRVASGKPDADSIEVWLSKGSAGFSLLLLPVNRASASTASIAATNADLSFAFLLGTEIRSEIGALLDELTELKAATSLVQTDFPRRLERFSQLLVFLELMADTFRAPEFVEGERISAQMLLAEVLTEMRGSQGDFVLNHEQSDQAGEQGFVYGHRQWLKTALKALVESLDSSAPPHCQIEIRIRQNGNFIVITGGFVSLQEWSRRRKTAPQQRDMLGDLDLNRTLRIDAGIRLTLAKQIIELHGGQLRLDSSDTDSTSGLIDGFTLLLPTGVSARGRSPTTCAQCIYPQQARSFATDLAQLLARKASPARMSTDELEMLAKLIHQVNH